MNIIEELGKLGIELNDNNKSAITKKFSEEVISVFEHEKKVKKAEVDRDTWKERAETAESTLKGFEGKDFDTIKKERDDWKKKAEEAEKEYSSKMAEHEKQELLKEAFANIEFTSNSAKNAIMAQISESVSVKNGKLIGFNDLLEDAKKNDASAFVDKEHQILEQNKVRFTTSMNNKGGAGNTLTRKDIMSIKDPVERQRKIAENIELFRK